MKTVMGNCERQGTSFEDGKWYCWQHSPKKNHEIGLALAKKRKEDWLKREKELDEEDKLRVLRRESGFFDLTTEELQSIIRFGGISNLIAEHLPKEVNS